MHTSQDFEITVMETPPPFLVVRKYLIIIIRALRLPLYICLINNHLFFLNQICRYDEILINVD